MISLLYPLLISLLLIIIFHIYNISSFKESPYTVFLTRKAGFNDGFGSQFKSLLGVYCLCKEYGFQYIHTPFDSVEQGLSSVQMKENNAEYTQRCNERINFLNNSKTVDANYTVIEEQFTSKQELSLEKLKKLKNSFVKIIDPYYMVGDNVEIYRHAKGIYPTMIPKNSNFTIGIHVRRGDAIGIDDQGKTDYVIDFDFKSDFNKLKCIFAYWDIFFAKSKKTKIS